MTITMENVSIYIGIVGFAVATVRVLIVTPIERSVGRLEGAIEKLDKRLAELDKKHDEDHALMMAIQESAKSAHKRLDEHIEVFHKFKEA